MEIRFMHSEERMKAYLATLPAEMEFDAKRDDLVYQFGISRGEANDLVTGSEDVTTRGTTGYCSECGDPMFLTPDEIAHHGTPEEIDFESDAHHVAILDS